MSGLRVIDVAGLGEECVIVDLEPQGLLLLDADLDGDERMRILNSVIREECS
jgi:hypothetical protein